MSLSGILRTGVSGMNAQSSKLGTVADNIANSATTGYKRSSVEFSSLITPTTSGSYQSGSVETVTRRAITEDGPLSYTKSGTDLAIFGEGFFVVTDSSDRPFLTRAGNFVENGATGDLVNTAGFTLMGRPLSNGADGGLLNAMTDLVPVNLASMNMQAMPSTAGILSGKLPVNDPVVATPAPAGANFGKKFSLEVYDNVGNPVKLDIYMSKTGANQWQAAIYNSGNAATFPGAPLARQALNFDGNGQLTGASSIGFEIPNGAQFTLDISGMSQLAGDYDVEGTSNGNAPSAVSGTEFSEDGVVYAVYDSGARIAAFQIPVATVASPNNLMPRAGNVFEATLESGAYIMGTPGSGGMGNLVAGALESSNVDLGTELTAMIEAQTAFSANSKSVQTGSEMLETVINLKR